MSTQDLLSFIEPHYKKNSKVHQLDYAEAVLDLSVYIAQRASLTVLHKEIVAAALLHDVFHYKSKEKHHILGCNFANSEYYPIKGELDGHGAVRVARAVLEHTPRYQGKLSSPLSAIIRSAVQGLPELDGQMTRAVMYGIDQGLEKDEAERSAISYLKQRYGSGSSVTYPDLYLQVFKDDLLKLRQRIDAL